jgi:hypothetical protein
MCQYCYFVISDTAVQIVLKTPAFEAKNDMRNQGSSLSRGVGGEVAATPGSKIGGAVRCEAKLIF